MAARANEKADPSLTQIHGNEVIESFRKGGRSLDTDTATCIRSSRNRRARNASEVRGDGTVRTFHRISSRCRVGYAAFQRPLLVYLSRNPGYPLHRWTIQVAQRLSSCANRNIVCIRIPIVSCIRAHFDCDAVSLKRVDSYYI